MRHTNLLLMGFLMCLPLACTKGIGPTLPVLPNLTPTQSVTSTPILTATPTATCAYSNAGMVTTLAGQAGVWGYADGMGTTALFKFATAITSDAIGNVYLADTGNELIRKITPGGIVSTLAGQAGVVGSVNGTGTSASFNNPEGVAADNLGNVYVSDSGNNLIRKITPGGVVSTLAGQVGVAGSTNGIGTAATFNFPEGLAVDKLGNVYVADLGNDLVRKITPAGVVSTVTGQVGVVGFTNGIGAAATFRGAEALAVDNCGNLYVADQGNNVIRKITSTGVVTTLAGSGIFGTADGTGTAASFSLPSGVAVDSCGDVFVADMNDDLIRKITSDGVVTTLAGSGARGAANGVGTAASFNSDCDVAVDGSGTLYISDRLNFIIRKIQ